MGVLDKIKNEIKMAGANKGRLLFVRDGAKKRIRFLTDMEDALEITMHDNYEKKINVPCLEQYGKYCPYCEMDDLRTRTFFAWSAYNYDENMVQLVFFPVNRCTPVPAMADMYTTYGTLTDRDYVFSVSGQSTQKTYTVIPMDKNRMRNTKIRPLSKKAVMDLIAKAYPADEETAGDDVGDDSYREKYEGHTPRELYDMCIERGLEAEKKKPEAYYINILSEADKSEDDWGDEGQEEEKPDYSSMKPKELYQLCMKKGIPAEKKQPKEYYINLLEPPEDDDDDWDEDEDKDEWETDDEWDDNFMNIPETDEEELPFS